MENKSKLILSGLIILSLFLLYWSFNAPIKGSKALSDKSISEISEHSEESFKKALESEIEENPCATPEGYTDDAWIEHMGHHPNQYKDCLSQTTAASPTKEITEEEQGHEDDEPHAVPHEFQDMINPVTVTEASIERGQELYALSCTNCHGLEGRGDGHMAMMIDPKPSDLQDAHVQEKSDGALFYIITEGVEETEMQGYKSLSEEDRWHLVSYLRTLK